MDPHILRIVLCLPFDKQGIAGLTDFLHGDINKFRRFVKILLFQAWMGFQIQFCFACDSQGFIQDDAFRHLSDHLRAFIADDSRHAVELTDEQISGNDNQQDRDNKEQNEYLPLHAKDPSLRSLRGCCFYFRVLRVVDINSAAAGAAGKRGPFASEF